MLSLLLAAALAAPVQAACDDVPTLIGRAEQAVIDGRLEAASATISQVESALGCAPVPAAELLARMWLADGTSAYLAGDEMVANLAFAAAARVAPETWVEGYGEQVRGVYQQAAQAEAASGDIRLHPDPKGLSATLDGVDTEFPTEAPSGLHLVQVGQTPHHTEYAEIFYLQPGQTTFIMTGVEPAAEPAVVEPEPVEAPATEPVAEQPIEEPAVAEPVAEPAAEPLVPPPVTPEPQPRAGLSSPVFLVLGGAAAAVAGGAGVVAKAQDGQMESAPNHDSLDRAYQRQQTFAYASYGLAGVAALSVTLHFVF